VTTESKTTAATAATEPTRVEPPPIKNGEASKPASSEPPASTPPPKAPRAWVMAMGLFAIVVGFGAGSIWGPAVVTRTKAVLSISSGTEDEAAPDDAEGSGLEFYTCGMHPWVILPEPGLCPICHMDLTPLDPEKFSGEISIDPIVTQNIGVRIAEVKSGPIVQTIRTVGTVAYDETRVRDINIKVSGWIENLYVDYEGVEVKKDDPLFDFYSPKLYSAQSEYLSSLKMRGRGGVAFLPETMLDAERLIEDARIQLEFFDITPEQIEAIEADGTPAKTMTIRSPYDGVVIAKHANEGMRINSGMRVYQIADLSKVWVMVSLYEYQLPFIEEGQEATMTLPYIPGHTFEGRVIYVYPYLNEQTRQIHVRLEFENHDGMLKPGMYASIELRSTLADEQTIAPRSAVIDTGERQVAFVSLGEGRFEPRDVQMGVATEDGFVEILDGLAPGEMVVVSGQFLLDSEARIRESIAKMLKGDLAVDQVAVADVVGASELASLPGDVSDGISTALTAYFQMGDLLANDTIEGIADPARRVAGAIDALEKTEIPDFEHFWHEHEEIAVIRDKSLEIAGMTDLEAARLAFVDLSNAFATLVKATGIPPSFALIVQELHCPMYQDGSSWLQPAGDVRNPFYGSMMLECFDERIALPVTGQGGDEAAPAPEPASEEKDMDHGSSAISPETQEAIDKLVSNYLEIQTKLTLDDLEGAAVQLVALQGAASQLVAASPPDSIADLASQLEGVSDLDAASLDTFRQGFRGLSETMIELVRTAPSSERVAPVVYNAYCPMEKASWLQADKAVANPYAPSMLRCGSIKEEFAAAAATGGDR